MKRTSVFIVPRASTAWKGNEAGWITSSGWASAARELWGDAVVATTDGVFTPSESVLFPRMALRLDFQRRSRRVGQFVPEILVTAIKDFRLWASKPKVWPVETLDWNSRGRVMMVWERHDLFPGPGRRFANICGAPFVLSVESLAVWEAEKWGVKRPFWGRILERHVEARSLKKADLVACVSEEVREKVLSLGVEPSKVLVAHNRVDSSMFHPDVDGTVVVQQYDLSGKIVIGWTGSFRAFHGLDTVLLAFREVSTQVPNAVLMLVGDGLEFEKSIDLAEKLGIARNVVFTGRRPVSEVPHFLSAFSIALVSAKSSEGFHYSPLKLCEYLAMGKAVIAPSAGDIPRQFRDGLDLLLYEAGNVADLATKLLQLVKNEETRRLLQENAIAYSQREGSWVGELRNVCDRLNIEY